MREVPVTIFVGSAVLDVCLRCYVVWFDRGEHDWLPHQQVPEPDTKIKDPELQEQMAYSPDGLDVPGALLTMSAGQKASDGKRRRAAPCLTSTSMQTHAP